ncbi:MAG: L-threonylcarbamoyladenylate synthase [Cyanobacteria bacterium P01_A01_bin.105]
MPRLSLSELAAYAASGVISFPTDTVAGVATLPHQGQRLYALKQRPLEKPLILMAARAVDLWPYVTGSAAEQARWADVAAAHWPGPLTLVLPASEQLPAAMNPMKTGTVGIRVPNHPVAQHVLSATGPLATTSANRSGEPALMDSDEIAAAFPQVGLLYTAAINDMMAGQPVRASGIASTVVRWSGDDWQVLRQGTIDL